MRRRLHVYDTIKKCRHSFSGEVVVSWPKMTSSSSKLIANRKYKGGFRKQVKNLPKIFGYIILAAIFIIIINSTFYERAIKEKPEDDSPNNEDYQIQISRVSFKNINSSAGSVEPNQRKNVFDLKNDTKEVQSNSTSSIIIQAIETTMNNDEENQIEITTKVEPNVKIKPLNTGSKDEEMVTAPAYRWCGFGNTFLPHNVSTLENTGKCCQEHDECSQKIRVGETRYGLQNNEIFTVSHCNCDEKFYKCLKQANRVVANAVGLTYFTFFGSKCFKEEHSVFQCAKHDSALLTFKDKNSVRCVEYSFDEKSPKNYSFFDMPIYKLDPVKL